MKKFEKAGAQKGASREELMERLRELLNRADEEELELFLLLIERYLTGRR